MLEDNRNIRGRYPHKLNGNTLKWIALLSMLIDHIGVVLLSGGSQNLFSIYSVCRCIGRISFPIFCFLIVEGFCHTSNVKRYIIRMFLFACLTEIPYDLAFFGKIIEIHAQQNVMFTFTIALLVLLGIRQTGRAGVRYLIIVLGCGAAYIFSTDGGFLGIVLIVVFYYFRENHGLRNFLAEVLVIVMSWPPTGWLALPLVECYNGERGKGGKYFFYWFYPLHLFVLWCLVR